LGFSVGITALGTYVPERILSNFDLEKMVETTDEWIRDRTGIQERRIAADGQWTSDLGVLAVRDLASRYGEGSLQGVDAVICATASPDAMFPATAAIIAHKLGLGRLAAFDVSIACSGFVYAAAVAQGLVVSGLYRKALVIAAETLSRIVDYTDRSTCVLFGDAAGAALVERVPDGYGFEAFDLGADGAGGKDLFMMLTADDLPGLKVPASKRLAMNGKEVFKFAVRIMADSALRTLEKAGLQASDLALFVPHQANHRIIEPARERLGLPPDRVANNLHKYGNTSTASVPLALREALDEGKVNDGDHILLVAFGGGLSWAGALIRWPGGATGERRPVPGLGGKLPRNP
jgi:3-oxoacyl-[acyl-carrier-protein] synthase-3